MIFLLDTNILVHILRNKRAYFEKTFQIHKPEHRLIISAVTIGELRAFSLRNKWGANKKQQMEELISEFFVVEIHNDAIHNRYAEIDTFSQGKLEGQPLPIISGQVRMSARNMGKNDLWIAATASIFNATLLSTDNDFDHLNTVFLNVPKIDLDKLTQY
jgi:tRNA(fMet)-specific endonuclease VapC